MIPLRDVIPSRTTPYITITIIVLNALAWLFEVSLPHDVLNEFLTIYGVVPAYFSWPTLITSMFLHGSWSHVIGNMWYLWIFGDNVEDRVGHGRFIFFYLLCGIAAALGQVAVNPSSMLPTIGASGAIAGVMGAYFVLYPHSRVLTLVPWIFIQIIELPAIVLLGFWFLMQLFSAGAIAVTASTHGSGGVAFAAHVVGFVAGLGGVFLFRKRQLDPWERVDF
ncbi:MAG: rhomboid family intramembrane serine protease [Acidobacteria bacterium]|nr:MAG: rhomboid family intramembrane serine protease [Acidobacteriota bacterium]PYR44249.1 MAG: rhomboid family intramembrane serine protease [Acidobacteriota bacterium]